MHLTNVKSQKRIEDHLSGRIARPDFIFYFNALIQFTLTVVVNVALGFIEMLCNFRDREAEVCQIVIWQIIEKDNFKRGRFCAYYWVAVRKRLINVFRDYALKNLVCLGEYTDYRGNVTRIMVESDYAKRYREKHREECKRWSEKKKASQPLKEKPAKRIESPEENRARKAAYIKEYYATHPDKLEERRAHARAYQKAKWDAKKAAAAVG